MNSNAFLNQVEVKLFSTLTSAMSEISHFRTNASDSTAVQEQPLSDGSAMGNQPIPLNQKTSLTSNWVSIKEALLPLFLWLVLGFATGFLIGIVQPR